tara:strand:- start:57 stop:566 length:510 start_codon:yes stop_codon:yes gene_type:complete
MSKLVVSTIETQNIKYDSDTTGMTIDAAGAVSMSNRLKIVGAHALVDYGGSVYVSKTAGIMEFDSIVENIGNHYSTSTYKFTCPVNGLYQASVGAISQNDTDKYGMDLYKSDVRVRRNYSVYRTIQATNFLICSAGDTLHWVLSTNMSLYEGTGIERYTYAEYSLMHAT